MNYPSVTSAVPNSPAFSTKSLINLDYHGLEVNLNEDGWFNATTAAERFGKRVDHWLKTDETKAYIDALMDALNTPKKGNLIKTKRGRNGGTWLHPRLAVVFARWLDVNFAIWCDIQIDTIIRGNHPHFDWKRVRHEATSSYKVMNAVLQLIRQNQGKETKFYHYANEAKLINWAITGEFKPLDRDSLCQDDLDLLAKLEERNAVLVSCGLPRNDRKLALHQFVSDMRAQLEIGVQ